MKINRILFLVLGLALLLRLKSLDQSLWLDEAINVFYAQSNSFWWFVTKYPLGDFHPPGYFAVLWLWGHLFGFSEVSVRMPSVIFGVLTVFLVYLIGKKLISRSAGFWAALFLAFSPLHIYYSQEARMYSLVAFASSLSFYFLVKLIQGGKLWLAPYAFSVSAVLYSDYLAYFIIPVQAFWVVICHKKSWKKFIIGLIGGLILWLPWLLIFPLQFMQGQATAAALAGWRDVVGGVKIKEALLLLVKTITGRISVENNYWYGLLFVVLVSPFVVTLLKVVKERLNARGSLFLGWLVVPPCLAFLVSFFVPVFSYFRFIFILPAFYLLTAYGVSFFNRPHKQILIAAILISELSASSIYLFNSQFHRENWRGAVEFINQRADGKTAVLLKNKEIIPPFRYYQKINVNVLPAFKTIPAIKTGDLNNLETNLNSFEKIYLFDYLTDVTDPKRLAERNLESLGFRQAKVYDFRGVGYIYLFRK